MFSFKWLISLFEEKSIKDKVKYIDKENSSISERIHSKCELLKKHGSSGVVRSMFEFQKVQTTHSNIVELIDFIKSVNKIIYKNDVIPSIICPFTQSEKTLNEIFINEVDRTYVDIDVIDDFILQAMKLTEVTMCYSDSDSGFEEHNLRVLNRVLQSIDDIVNALIECSNV